MRIVIASPPSVLVPSDDNVFTANGSDGVWLDGGTERASTPKDLVQIDLMPDTPGGVTTYT